MSININRISVHLGQEGNTLGTTPETETLDIICETALTSEEGCFVVLKTKGWSIDSGDEIKTLKKQLEDQIINDRKIKDNYKKAINDLYDKNQKIETEKKLLIEKLNADIQQLQNKLINNDNSKTLK